MGGKERKEEKEGKEKQKNIIYYADRIVRSIIFIIASIPFFIVIILIPLLIRIMRKDIARKLSERQTLLWYKLIFKCFGIKLRVKFIGKRPGGKFLIYSNHMSFLDIPAISLAFEGKSIKFLAKEEVFSIPIIGWGMKIQEHPSVRQNNVISSIRGAISCLNNSDVDALCIFPEGTRGEAGRNPVDLLPFRDGVSFFFDLLKLPTYPVAVLGTEKIMPPGAWIPRKGTINLVVGDECKFEIDMAMSKTPAERRKMVTDHLREKLRNLISMNERLEFSF